MADMDRQILEELQALRRQMAGMTEAKTEVPAPVDEHPARLMSDYDCLLICMADDVSGAIDRWNRTAKARARAATSH